jgi:hypothetical protein
MSILMSPDGQPTWPDTRDNDRWFWHISWRYQVLLSASHLKDYRFACWYLRAQYEPSVRHYVIPLDPPFEFQRLEHLHSKRPERARREIQSRDTYNSSLIRKCLISDIDIFYFIWEIVVGFVALNFILFILN